MKTKREKHLKETINTFFNLSTSLKIRITLFILGVVFLTHSCKPDEKISSTIVYGLSISKTNSTIEQSPELDSIVQLDLTNGIYKNVSSIDKFEGLRSTRCIAHSNNKNALIYYYLHTISLIYLDNISRETIDLKIDSTYTGVKSLLIIEKKNLLVLFQGHYNFADKSRSLDIVEIDLNTKRIIKSSKLMDFDYSHDIFTTIDETNNRIFILPDNSFSEPLPSDKLYIYNYERNELTNQPINETLIDVHYSSINQCLVGNSDTKDGYGLLSYSIINMKTDIIGLYSGITGILPSMNYYDKNTNSYWLGILSTQGPDYIKLTNISLLNASFSKNFSISKRINIIN